MVVYGCTNLYTAKGGKALKIKDFSEEKGLTKQAVYKAIQRAGFSTKQITDQRGNISAKGFTILHNLFPDPEQKHDAEEKKHDADKSAEVEQLQKRIEELELRCKEWEKRYFEATEAAKQEGQQLRILLSQEQQLRLAAENKGFFKRLFAGRKEKE